MNRIARKTGLATMALTLSLGMAACGGDDGGDTASDDTSSSASETPSESASETPTESESADAAAADGTFGDGCAAIPTDPSDPGSFEGMATEPVATAASGNPLLKTLVAAVTEAGLVDTLNSAEGITVFAPTDDAFAKIPPKTLKKVLADKKTLTAILTHHVVGETLTPDNLAGTFDTLNKDELTVEGSGDMFTADSEEKANIICGNITTANAKVYVIDTVMMPQM
ncbi:fasciclin domain-containing protein [Nocardioides currus]|uniref:Beta-Ig-H3/fasciclin n=1 Tax=Nocardioides currus TaxID=2133958 RepID=A0A2R7YYH0_9ACTN|nr:fasciclin domain-containing protein [Nocardioides currus]PUA81354.1 beta-Ig-H3/fasciclin [Nocardioides currus]